MQFYSGYFMAPLLPEQQSFRISQKKMRNIQIQLNNLFSLLTFSELTYSLSSQQ